MSAETARILERKARIFNVQKYSIYDGPGIRTLIFFQGCPLRCQWCSNPEGLERKYQVMYQEELCIDCGNCVDVCPVKIHNLAGTGGKRHQVERQLTCVGCRRCEESCPRQAISIAGQEKTISEVLEIIQQDALFYLSSGGGVTLGGGEVTAQPEFAAHLLQECRSLGIHTAIETCGYAKLESLLKIAAFTDLFLFDIKHIDAARHQELTGVRNEPILTNLTELIKRGYSVRIRMPLLRGLNADEATIRRTLTWLEPLQKYRNLLGVDLLPYHKLGINKYKQLGLTYPLQDDFSLTEAELSRIESWVAAYKLAVNLIRH